MTPTPSLAYAQRFQSILDPCDADSTSTKAYFDDLLTFTADLKAEDERAMREGLTDDELEIFDLLFQETMTQAETQKMKPAARGRLHRLNDDPPKVLVRGGYKTDQTRRIVRLEVAEVLDRKRPQNGYDRGLVPHAKCDNVFHLALDHAAQGRKWAA